MTEYSTDPQESWSAGVSVLMVVYNGAQTIGGAIESVLQQSYDNWELIVVDDGSTDSTAEVVRSFPDPRIKLFMRAHAGRVDARNYGLQQCQSNLIAILDADDLMTRHRLEIQRQAALHAPNVGVHASWYRIIETNKIQISPLSNRSITRLLWRGSSLGHSTVMFNRDQIPHELSYPEDNGIGCEDLSLFLALSIKKVRFQCLPKALTLYSDHANSRTKRLRAEKAYLFRTKLLSEISKNSPQTIQRFMRSGVNSSFAKSRRIQKYLITFCSLPSELLVLCRGLRAAKR